MHGAPPELVAALQAGEERAVARAISLVEEGRPLADALLRDVFRQTGRATVIGLTGPPGAGKSSLADRLVASYRALDRRVGVVAVDPSSAYSGGAILGDRVRMQRHATDPGVFIRSMATRGQLGGLSRTTNDAVDLLDAAGFDPVLVETVGVGQTELEITVAADTVIVVLVPESGDAIQAMKAGLMEIADIFVVNKSDRPGSARVVKEIRQALHLRAGHGIEEAGGHHGFDPTRSQREARPVSEPPVERDGWEIPVLETNGLDGQGVEALLEAIEGHRMWLERSGELGARRRGRARGRVRDVVEREMKRIAWTSADVMRELDEGLDRIAAGKGTPYSVARKLLALLVR